MLYVIQVFSRKENQVIEKITTSISSDIFSDVFSPTRKRLRKLNGNWKQIEEKLFPGYLFIETTTPELLHTELYKITDFTKLLGNNIDNQIHFIPLSEEEERYINILADKTTNHVSEISNIQVLEGKKIQVIDGPLVGLQGFVTKIDLHKRTATISLDIMGGNTKVKLGIDIIEEI